MGVMNGSTIAKETRTIIYYIDKLVDDRGGVVKKIIIDELFICLFLILFVFSVLTEYSTRRGRRTTDAKI